MGAIGQGSIQLMLRSKLGDAVSTMRPVNMSAHGGLRGILALHVALFHFLLFSDLKLHTCGNVHMPFFFLLSGFSLSATYPNLDINTSWLALKGFYQNRLARCLPVFYLCNAVGIILTYFKLDGVAFKLGRVAFRHVKGPVADVSRLVEDQPLLAGQQVGDPVAALAELRAAGPVGEQAPLGLHVPM